MLRFILILGLMVVPMSAKADDEPPTLSIMIDTVQGALLDAQKLLKNNQRLPLQSVKLSLNTINTLEAGGRVGFWVFTVGASAKDSVTSNIEITLVPPDAEASNPVSTALKIREVLTEAIFEGAAARSAAVQGQPPLEATNFKVSLEFALVIDGDGKLSLAVPPFTGELGGGLSSSQTQKIVLIFG